MQTVSTSNRISNTSATGGIAAVDWNQPLDLITTAFVIVGVSAFFRTLPIPDEYAWLLTFIVLAVWRYGMHRAGIFRWHWRRTPNYSIYSLKQGFLTAVAFFVFVMAICTSSGTKPTLYDAALAAIGGLVVGLLGVNSKAQESNSHPQSASS